jgi:2'-5' RNA ligase
MSVDDPALKPVRLFFGVPLPESATAMLEEALVTLKKRARDRVAVRWSRPEQFHITLKFLGWVAPDRVPELARIASEEPALTPPVHAELTGFTAFPSPRRARVVVAELAGADDLRQLAGRVEARAEVLGFARERRPFRPHITVGRLNPPRNASEPLEALMRFPEPFWLDQLVLYRSVLGPGGSVYERLAGAPFGGEHDVI